MGRGRARPTVKNRSVRTWIFSAVAVGILIVVPPAWPDTPREIAQKSFPSVVFLMMEDVNGRPVSFGSGFFIREDAIATNVHVIEGTAGGAARIVGKQEKYRLAGVLATDSDRDIAVVQVVGVQGSPLPLGDPDQTLVGDEVYAIGNPRGLEGTFSSGIVSALRRSETITQFQITAPISPGSSGGPVLNRRGEVIGIATSSMTQSQNLNFAVSISHLVPLLAKLRMASPFANVTPSRPLESEEDRQWRIDIRAQISRLLDQERTCVYTGSLAQIGLDAALRAGDRWEAARKAGIVRNSIACIDGAKEARLPLEGALALGRSGVAAREAEVRRRFTQELGFLLTKVQGFANVVRSNDAVKYDEFVPQVEVFRNEIDAFKARNVLHLKNSQQQRFVTATMAAAELIIASSETWKSEARAATDAAFNRRELEKAQRQYSMERSFTARQYVEQHQHNAAAADSRLAEAASTRRSQWKRFQELVSEASAAVP